MAQETETMAQEPDESSPSPITSNTSSSTVETGISKPRFFVESRPEQFIRSAREQPLPKRVLMKKLPELLAEKEGSYTNLNDLLKHDGTFSVDLRSEWATRYLFPGRSLPNLRVRISENPETGEYQPAGGALTLPGGSLEAGYEVNPETEESKATLQWKKSF
jgi:hypothetical protein